MNPKYKYIALDIGNVCIHLDYDACAQKLGFKSLEILQDKKEIWEKNELFEEGKITEKDFLNVLAQNVPEKLSQQKLKMAWESIIGKEVQGMKEAVAWMLTHNITPVFFSNTSSIHYQYLQTFLSFFGQVPHAVLSFEEGFSKPDCNIYKIFELKYNKPLLYIDDKLENLTSGCELGWNTYQMGNIGEMMQVVKEILSQNT